MTTGNPPEALRTGSMSTRGSAATANAGSFRFCLRSRKLALAMLIVLGAACAPAAGREATSPTARPLPSETPTTTVLPSSTATSTASVTPEPQATLIPTPIIPAQAHADQAQAMLAAYAEDVDSLPGATRYVIDVDVTFDPAAEKALISGVARILYTNMRSEPVPDLALMLWPNDEQYLAEMELGAAMVEGQLAEAQVSPDGIAARINLPEPLAMGKQVDVSVAFRVDAYGPIAGGAPKRFGVTRGVFAAPTFYPLVPRLVNGIWQTDPAPPGGDTTTSDVAFYDVTIRAPADLALVATGVEVDRRQAGAGRHQLRFLTGPVRDFAFALGALELASSQVDGTAINVWVLPEHNDDVRRVMNAAEIQVGLLNQLVGRYPYRELDLVDVPGAFGGIEYPGIVFIGTLGTNWIIDPTVHEVAHQWFYALIGNDQLAEPWLDEAAASFAQVLYYEQAINPGRGTSLLVDFHERLLTSSNPDAPIGLPVAAYSPGYEYALIVYSKGALFFEALRAQMGARTFYTFLQNYFQAARYRIATGGDFQREAELACDCDLDAVFDLWVYRGGEVPLP